MRTGAEPTRPALVTVHLWRVPARGVPAAVARMGLDRRPVRHAPGLRFFKLLGTGHGDTFTPADANPRRWGLLATWADPAAAAAFEASPTVRRWRQRAEETWRAELRPLSTRGRWAGRTPFGPDGISPDGTSPDGISPDGVGAPGEAAGGATAGEMVAAVTRARLSWRRSARFWRAAPRVAADLRDRSGLRLAVGIGESPVGVAGTFSVWDSARALRAFAYGGPPHTDAIRRTAAEGWYVEELFARFAVVAAAGTVDGRDPLG
jgi:quinol monooxygenase YgiN